MADALPAIVLTPATMTNAATAILIFSIALLVWCFTLRFAARSNLVRATCQDTEERI
jgi:uncharacterized membrane protein YqjE